MAADKLANGNLIKFPLVSGGIVCAVNLPDAQQCGETGQCQRRGAASRHGASRLGQNAGAVRAFLRFTIDTPAAATQNFAAPMPVAVQAAAMALLGIANG